MQVTAPTEFSAVLVASSDDVTWAVTGGTLSSTSGLHVIYTPPAGSATGTLTATAGKLTASVQISSRPSQLTDKTIPGLTAAVAVQYDAQEVPHIQCAVAADCLAVQGYIQARDRWFPMDFLRHVARGRVAELIGPAGLEQDIQFRTFFTTRDGKRLDAELVKAIDPDTRALLDAFVAGINAYLAELKATPNARLPGEYAQLPFRLTPADMESWTAEDTMALSRLNQFQLSESLGEELANAKFAMEYGSGAPHDDPGKMEAWIRAASPVTEQANTLSATATTATASPAGRLPTIDFSKWGGAVSQAAANLAALGNQLKPADGSTGSNNWVVSAAKSATGVAMVANDPHLSLQYPPLFHLAAMTSAKESDNLDLTGGSFSGIPGALVGRGKNVGWGVTVVGYDVTDVYLEQFPDVAQCPDAPIPCVQFGTNKVSLVVAPEKFMVRVGPGPSGVVDAGDSNVRAAFPGLPGVPPSLLVVPHHGPVIDVPKDLAKGVGGAGLSFRWTGHETNTQDLKAFYGLNTAKDVDAAILALKDFATGAQNFVLADDQGHIAYDPHALVPVRPFAVKGTPLRPWFPLPGDGSAEWGPPTSSCAAPGGVPASCWIADDQLPQGKDPEKGYFFTANADPIGVSNDNDPLPDPDVASDPPYMSFDWSDSSGFRATRIEQRIKTLLGPNGDGKVSLADMESIQADHVSRPGMAFAPFIQAATLAGNPPELTAAKAVLAPWEANGFDCPSGVVGTDPKLGPSVSDAKVLENSAGCFLFHMFLRTLATNVFTDDLRAAGQGVNALSAIKAMLFMLDPDSGADTSFCNDVDTKGATVATHTCSEQVATALVQSYRSLSTLVGRDPSTWIWGRVHTMTPVSLLPLVTTGYEPGPYARPGGAFTVDVGNPSLSGGGLDFAYGSGGNVRHISLMDPASPKVRMQLPGPERDGPALTVGPDLLGQWVTNTYFDYAAGNQIDKAAVSTQSFKAP